MRSNSMSANARLQRAAAPSTDSSSPSASDGFLRVPDRFLEHPADDGRVAQIDQGHQEHPRMPVLQPPRDLHGFLPEAPRLLDEALSLERVGQMCHRTLDAREIAGDPGLG